MIAGGGDDLGAKISKDLDSIDMIGMIVGGDDFNNGLSVTSRINAKNLTASEGEPSVSITTTPSSVITAAALDIKPSLFVAIPALPCTK